MEKTFKLPLVKCDYCKSDFSLIVEWNGFKLGNLFLKCKFCDNDINIYEKSSNLYKSQKQKLKPLIKRLTKLILEAKEHVPKNKDELDDAIKNPSHPFTATVITSIIILLMEMSGFTIFMVVSWILGNLILTPLGWFLIPVIVAIVFTHKEKLKSEKMRKMGEKLKVLDKKLDEKKISKDEFEKERNKLFDIYFN